jgi:hypothetical protein
MINLQQWPCAPRCGQGQGLCLPSAIPTSNPGRLTAKPADIYLKHTNADCAVSIARQSTPPLHSTKPAQSLNPHRSSCWARGFLHGRLSYASVRNPSPSQTPGIRFSILSCRRSAFPIVTPSIDKDVFLRPTIRRSTLLSFQEFTALVRGDPSKIWDPRASKVSIGSNLADCLSPPPISPRRCRKTILCCRVLYRYASVIHSRRFQLTRGGSDC